MTAPEPTIHIVYGIPCVGKSTGAISFAHRHDIRTVIHTDYIREVQRGISPDNHPVLAKVTHNAWELYGPPTPLNIIVGFLSHVSAVAPAINLVIRKLVDDGFTAIVEGAHFHATFIGDLRRRNPAADIQATLLIAETDEELKQRAVRKGRQRASGQPLKEWQDNIPYMLAIQDYLISEAHSKGIRVSTEKEWRESWN